MQRKQITDAVKAILSDLIAIPSTDPPGDTTAICAYAAERLSAAGYATETLSRADGVANAVGRMGEGQAVAGVQRPCRHRRCRRARELAHRPVRRHRDRRQAARDRRGQLQGVDGGPALARRAHRRGRRAARRRGGVHLRGRRGAAGRRRARLPAGGRGRPARLPRPRRADRVPGDRRGAGRVLDPADRARPRRPCRRSRGRRQRDPPHDAADRDPCSGSSAPGSRCAGAAAAGRP